MINTITRRRCHQGDSPMDREQKQMKDYRMSVKTGGRTRGRRQSREGRQTETSTGEERQTERERGTETTGEERERERETVTGGERETERGRETEEEKQTGTEKNRKAEKRTAPIEHTQEIGWM